MRSDAALAAPDRKNSENINKNSLLIGKPPARPNPAPCDEKDLVGQPHGSVPCRREYPSQIPPSRQGFIPQGFPRSRYGDRRVGGEQDRKSTRLNSSH